MAASRSCCAKRTQTPTHPHLRVHTSQTFFITLLGPALARDTTVGSGTAPGTVEIWTGEQRLAVHSGAEHGGQQSLDIYELAALGGARSSS